MASRIRWGILGTGSIAKKFTTGLRVLSDAEISAVGSRSAETAHAFADQFSIPRRHASYEALANDPDIDVIYIATPHSFHKDNALLALRAGKAVLCEKPFTINTKETEEVIQCARERGLFLMEAVWTRFLPVWRQVRAWLADRVIGDVRMFTADFGFRAGLNPEGRLFNPALGGGSLLDIGIYPVSLSFMLFGGPPSRIATLAHLGETGVDEQAGILFGYPQGQLAVLSSAIRTTTPQEVHVLGTEGSIKVHSPYWCGTTATLSVSGQSPKIAECPLVGNGYNYEAVEVMRCLRAGELESPGIPLDETLAVMRTLDTIRAQWGLKYPNESMINNQ